MKFFFSSAFLFFLFLSGSISAQNPNWITPNKLYIKLSITEDGIYRIDKSDFTNLSINTSNIDPRTVKVIYKGAQIPIFFEGENDGVFGDNDYFDFFAQRNYGGPTNYLDGYTFQPKYTTNEYYNEYSDTNAYWVDWGGNNGLRYNIVNSQNNLTLYDKQYYLKNYHFEQDKIYSLGEKINPTDFRIFNTERVQGETWYWKQLTDGTSQKDSAANSNFFSSPQNLCEMRLFIYPNSLDTHKYNIRINSQTVSQINKISYNRLDTIITFPSNILTGSANNLFEVFYTHGSSNPNIFGNVYFDLMSLDLPVSFTFENNRIGFETRSSDTSRRVFKIKGFNGANQVNIYDVRNNQRIVNYSVSADTLIFSGKQNGKFFVENKTITKKPVKLRTRMVTNLVSNQANYLIIYHKLFESQAELLRAHRQSYDTLIAKKVDIEDVMDVFNYGIDNAIAVRNFVRNAYANWQTPKLKYICLFGRASLDPKKNASNTVYYKNYIPTYGNPPSDGYFANINATGYKYFQQIPVGRIPAYDIDEANNAVEKIIAYDNERNNFSSWWKTSVFITGGLDSNEQNSFKSTSNSMINTYMAGNPLRLSSKRIYRDDDGSGITFAFSDSIKNSFNEGAMFMNYIGHAGNGTWDNGLENPNIINNGNKLPVLFSMTCFTGKNSIPEDRGFGEKFIYLPDKGAIGFIGNTGWTFASSGIYMNQKFLESFKGGSRRVGDMFKFASVSDSLNSSYPSIFTVNTYNLLGDPASKVLIPNHPEFVIKPADYSLSNPFPAVGEQFTVYAYPNNYGINADSCKISFQLFKNNALQNEYDTIIRNFGYYRDTVSYGLSINTNGYYKMKVTVDSDNWYPVEYKPNNTITFDIPLRNISYVPLKPYPNSIIRTDSVEFVGINPNVNPYSNNVKVYLQLDTTSGFTSPMTYFKTVTGDIKTKFKLEIPYKTENKFYFWRMNALINNIDSSGWSPVQNFVYSNSLRKDNSAADSLVSVIGMNPKQFDKSEINNLQYTGNGFELNTYEGNLRVRSYGNRGEAATEFEFNGSIIRIDDVTRFAAGLFILKLNKFTGNFIEFKNVRMSTAQSSDSLVNILNTFDTTHILMIAKAHFTPGENFELSPAALDKLHQFGSEYADSIGSFGYYNQWSFLSYKANNQNITSEAYWRNGTFCQYPVEPGTCYAECTKLRNFSDTAGYISKMISPSNNWINLSWAQELNNTNDSVKFDIYGINRDNKQVSLFSNVSNNTSFDLSSINSYDYPSLLLRANLKIDSTSTESPVLNNFKLSLVPPAELIPDNYSFQLTDTAVQEGDTINIKIKYQNVGYINIKDYITTWYVYNKGKITDLKVDTVNTFAFIDSAYQSEIAFNTAGYSDTVNIYFDVTPFNNQNEFFTYNNTAVTSVFVQGDSLQPEMEITYNGIEVQNGDFIQSKPDINIDFFDDSRLVITGIDTSLVRIKLNGQFIPYYINSTPNPELQFIIPDDYKLLAKIIYKPILTNGNYRFEYIAKDKSGNPGDTVKHSLTVDDNLKILDLTNYPNPMKNETSFMFSLRGGVNPGRCTIKIYTVAGRLVKQISANANIGYNQILWDGRDADGDNMANGVYLYKMIIEGDSKIETSTQKLVILK